MPHTTTTTAKISHAQRVDIDHAILELRLAVVEHALSMCRTNATAADVDAALQAMRDAEARLRCLLDGITKPWT